MKRLLAVLLCIFLPVCAVPAAAEPPRELADLARQELEALGCDLSGYEVSLDDRTDKVIFSWPGTEGDRIVAWGEYPEEGEPFLLAFGAEGYGSVSGRQSPFSAERVSGCRLAALGRYVTDPTPWMISHTLGDVDGDGKVTTSDARLLLGVSVMKFYSHRPLFSRDDPEAALGLRFTDVNGDGMITTSDARLILQRAVGSIPAFPVET